MRKARELFNGLFEIESELLGNASIASSTAYDSRQGKNVSNLFLDMIDDDMENFFSQQTFIGSTVNRFESTSTLLVNKDYTIKTNRMTIESADIAEIIMKLSQQETQLQAALNVGGRVLSMSLLNYLR